MWANATDMVWVSCVCVSVCISVFMCGASAMKVNAWTCAPATDRDLDCWDLKDGACSPRTVKGMYPAPHIHEHLATANCVHLHAQHEQPGAHCEQWHGDHKAHWRVQCAVLSTPRTVCWCTCVHTSHLWLKVSPCVSFHIIHACALVSCLLSGLSSPVSLLLHPVPLPALPDVQLGAWWDLHWRSPVQLQLGEHGHSGLCHTPSQVMSPRRWSSQTPMSWTSRPPAISTSRTPWTTRLPSPTFLTSTTMSLRNSLQLWSIEQGNLLRWEATMINFPVTSETWKVLRVSFLWSPNPKEWSVKLGGLFKQESLRSVKALTHRLGQCWMNSEERLSLNAVRKFFITNSSQLKPKKIAKFYKKNYCGNNRNFVKFINKILWNRRNCKNSKILPSMSSPRRNSLRIRRLLWNYLEDFKIYRMK